jgi:hypothetical protein
VIIAPLDADALLQQAGIISASVSPGETKNLTWNLQSNEEQTITIQITVEGKGSEFLNYPKIVEIKSKQDISIPIQVTIPVEYQKESSLLLTMVATKLDVTNSSTILNLQLAKSISISIIDIESQESLVIQNEFSQIQQDSNNPQDGGGCLVATAAYGSELQQPIQELREFRDNKLSKSPLGFDFLNNFNTLYYSFSPYIADMERENPMFKELVKNTIIPLVYSLSILNHVSTDTEIETFFWITSILSLNIGLYIIFPMIILWQIKKKSKSLQNIT